MPRHPFRERVGTAFAHYGGGDEKRMQAPLETTSPSSAEPVLETGPETRRFYEELLDDLEREKIPFLVGGTFALYRYTGIGRVTKDLDLFLRFRDVPRLRVLEARGYEIEQYAPHWLYKVRRDGEFADLVFSSANGVARVDETWFIHARHGRILGRQVAICPPEETLWSKAFIMERERYDGADVIHLLLATAEQLDWDRLLERFDDDWRVLLSHLILFGYVYPGRRDSIPKWVLADLLERFWKEMGSHREPEPGPEICRGTLLSASQFVSDLEAGLRDARLSPDGGLLPEEIQTWTEALAENDD